MAVPPAISIIIKATTSRTRADPDTDPVPDPVTDPVTDPVAGPVPTTARRVDRLAPHDSYLRSQNNT